MKTAALALVALTLTAAPAAAQRQTETVDRTLPFAAGGTLKLKNFSGDTTITGTAGQEVVVHAVRRGTRERLDNIKLDIQAHGSTIEIEANKRNENWREKNDNVVETQFEIQVPFDTKLDLYAFSGTLSVREVVGEIKAQTFSGNIDLDVSRATDTPEIEAETFSGDMKVRIPPAGSGRIEFESFSGDLDSSEVPVTVQRSSRRNMSGTIGSGAGGKMEFKSFSGDVKLMK
jgi:DUF4097 and DUF4098 domain-containing protein YvlB